MSLQTGVCHILSNHHDRLQLNLFSVVGWLLQLSGLLLKLTREAYFVEFFVFAA
jgi:hypothetical protein